MNKIISTIGCLLAPFFISSSVVSGEFPVSKNCEKGYSEDVYAVASVVYAECRGEPIEGQIAVIDVIRNRAEKKGIPIAEATKRGMVSGKLDHRFVLLADSILKLPVGHEWTYFHNPDIATDTKWLRKTKTWPRTKIGGHVFMRKP